MKKSLTAAVLVATCVVAVVGWPGPSLLAPVGAAPAPARHLAPQAAKVPQATTPKLYLQAAIIPAATFAVGTSASGGPDGRSFGYGLSASGIDNSWAVCTCAMDFAIFVFTNEADTANVEFKMVSPSNHVVYHYTWPSDKLGVGGNWFSMIAKGAYTAPGTYFAEVDVAGQLDGWIPLKFSRAT